MWKRKPLVSMSGVELPSRAMNVRFKGVLHVESHLSKTLSPSRVCGCSCTWLSMRATKQEAGKDEEPLCYSVRVSVNFWWKIIFFFFLSLSPLLFSLLFFSSAGSEAIREVVMLVIHYTFLFLFIHKPTIPFIFDPFPWLSSGKLIFL